MAQDWIVDVLADLRSFALQNNLKTLAEQLDDTLLVAATEIAQSAPDVPEDTDDHVSTVGRLPGRFASGQIA
ncbi:MAG: hypothetical protein QNI90_17500 [Dinoroseobacter sp.]|nr:hypothetical protein [Dinoroseobacter sp.]